MAKPLKLIKSHTYSGYQLYSKVRYIGQTADFVYRFVGATVLEWLRARIDEEPFPEELQTPDAEAAAFDESLQFKSYHYHGGFSIDITALNTEGIWALQLKEPDVGKDGNAGMPGRTITTNIALHMLDEEWIEMGIRTDVTDPVNRPEMESTYRPAIIRTLLINEHIEIVHQSPIRYKEIRRIETPTGVETSMREILNEKQCLPAVIFTYIREKRKVRELMLQIDTELKLRGKEGSFSKLLDEKNLPNDLMSLGPPTLPYDVKKCADTVYGYGRTYLATDDAVALIREKLNTDFYPGDILLIEPKCFGGKITTYHYEEYPEKYNRDTLLEKIIKQITCYSKGKDVPFHETVFEEKAREIERRRRFEEIKERSREDLESLFEEQENKIDELEQTIKELNDKNRYLETRLEQIQQNREDGIMIERPDIEEAFPEEMHDLILCILKETEAAATYAVEGSRAQMLLQTINAANKIAGYGIDIFEKAKEIISRNTLTDSDKSTLEALGFRIKYSENNHPRLYLKCDNQHCAHFASTPSDHRSGKNGAKDVKKFLSIYK